MRNWLAAFAPLDPCPIIVAPMAGAGGVELAAAAMRGGAIGSLPCALIDAGQVVAQAKALRDQADGPINLNFFAHTMPLSPDETAWRERLRPYYAEYGVSPAMTPGTLRRPFDDAAAAAVEQVRPELVSFHFGLPKATVLDRVRRTGARVIATATSLAEARLLERAGVDAIIAQGWEAGGHRGDFLDAPEGSEMGLFALLPQMADAVDVPVIAAGGIADERGIAAALMLGASAVQIGSAYLHCPESLISTAHRAKLAGEAAETTRFTNVMSGRRARGLGNRVIEELGPMSDVAPPFPRASPALAPLKAAAEALGRDDFSAHWSGQAARLGRSISATELTRTLAHDARTILQETYHG